MKKYGILILSLLLIFNCNILSINAKETKGQKVVVTDGKKLTITNEKGKYIQFNDVGYNNSTMKYYDIKPVGNNLEIYAEPYKSIEMTNFSKKADIKIDTYIDGNYGTAEVDGANSVYLNSNKVNVKGSNYYFKIGLTTPSFYSKLITFSANSTQGVNLLTGSDKLVLKTSGVLTDTKVNIHEDSGIDERVVSGNIKKIVIKNKNGKIKIKTVKDV